MCSKQKTKIQLPEKNLNETEINNLHDKESKIMVIKAIIKFGKIEEHSKNFNKR